MSDGNAALSWLVIRQDDNGNRYRVGRYDTEDEARRMVDTLYPEGQRRLYSVEPVEGSAR
ncbi:SPOR domain-containing protein [Streptomyces sp. NPDC006798]|uniref:SPOR domain-containing protein n=1 Tax=unclassified Streptomyces TaxID=2593676 RepID=UPI00340E7595